MRKPDARSDSMTEGAAQDQFVRLLTEHQRQLYTYILTLLAHPVDADDVLQETNVVMCAQSSRVRARHQLSGLGAAHRLFRGPGVPQATGTHAGGF